jgi:hypothetical protein
VKDLWGLYVSCLNVKVAETSRSKARKEDDSDDDDDEDNDEDESGSEMSIMKENSSEEEEYFNVEPHPRKRGQFRSDIQLLIKYPTLLLSPLFSYLAIISLRLPISVYQVYEYVPHPPVSLSIDIRWIIEDKIPYTRADKLIPAHLFRQLHPRTQHRFQVTVSLIHSPLMAE